MNLIVFAIRASRSIKRNGLLRKLRKKYFFIGICVTFLSLGVRRKKIEIKDGIPNLFLELGPVFIKFGQLLSIRSDIVGDHIAQSLRKLQDRVSPESWKTIKKTISESIPNYENIFIDIEKTPIASASIAQVHKATLKDIQKPVALKIKRRNINRNFKKNIKLLKKLAKISEILSKNIRQKNLIDSILEMEKWMEVELDLRLEAASASKFKELNKNDNNIYVYDIYWNLTSESILVTEYLQDTHPIDQIALHPDLVEIPTGVLFYRFLSSLFRQIFEYGYFHADIHYGNILVQKNGTICPVDYGIMGNLSLEDRIFLASVFKNFFDRNYEKMTEVHLRYGILKHNEDLDLFSLKARAIGERMFERGLHNVSLESLLRNLYEVMAHYKLPIYKNLLLFHKTFLMAEGMGRQFKLPESTYLILQDFLESWYRRGRNIQLLTLASQKIQSTSDWFFKQKEIQKTKQKIAWILPLSFFLGIGVASGLWVIFF